MYKIEKHTDTHYIVSTLDGSKLNEKMEAICLSNTFIDKHIKEIIDYALVTMIEQPGVIG